MAEIEELKVKISADTSSFDKSVDESTKKLKKITDVKGVELKLDTNSITKQIEKVKATITPEIDFDTESIPVIVEPIVDSTINIDAKDIKVPSITVPVTPDITAPEIPEIEPVHVPLIAEDPVEVTVVPEIEDTTIDIIGTIIAVKPPELEMPIEGEIKKLKVPDVETPKIGTDDVVATLQEEIDAINDVEFGVVTEQVKNCDKAIAELESKLAEVRKQLQVIPEDTELLAQQMGLLNAINSLKTSSDASLYDTNEPPMTSERADFLAQQYDAAEQLNKALGETISLEDQIARGVATNRIGISPQEIPVKLSTEEIEAQIKQIEADLKELSDIGINPNNEAVTKLQAQLASLKELQVNVTPVVDTSEITPVEPVKLEVEASVDVAQVEADLENIPTPEIKPELDTSDINAALASQIKQIDDEVASAFAKAAVLIPKVDISQVTQATETIKEQFLETSEIIDKVIYDALSLYNVTDNWKNFDASANVDIKTSDSVKKEYIKQIDAVVEYARLKLDILKQQLATTGDTNLIPNVNELNEYITLLEQYRAKVADNTIDIHIPNAESVSTTIQALASDVDSLKLEIDTLGNSAGFMKLTDQIAQLRTMKPNTQGFTELQASAAATTKELQKAGVSAEDFYKILQKLTGFDKYMLFKFGVSYESTASPAAASSSSANILSSIGKSIDRASGNILKGLIGIRSTYMIVRRIVSQNAQMTQAINNLMTFLGNLLATPLTVLASVLNGLVTLFGGLLNVSTSTQQDTAKISKTVASFDELELLQSNSASSSSSSAAATEIPTLSELYTEMPKLQSILETIAKALGIIAGWKLVNALTSLAGLPALTEVLKSIPFGDILKLTAGVSLVGIGIKEFAESIRDALQGEFEGWDWLKLFGGSAAVIAGGALIGSVFGDALKGGILGGVALSVTLLFESIEDMQENGTTIGNTIGTVVGGGLLGGFLAVLVGLPALVVAPITALIAAIGVMIYDGWDEITNFFTVSIPEWWNGITERWNAWRQRNDELTAKQIQKFKDDWASIKKFFSDLWNGLVTGVQNFVTRAGEKFANIKTTFKTTLNDVIAKVETAVNNIVTKFNNTGLIRGINKILGTNITLPTIKIARLAKGGVFTSPTVGLMGEYANAATNPEIVAPQSIMKETIDASNTELAKVMVQMGRQIIGAIENNQTEITLDGTSIAKSVAKANNNYKLRTGTSLI